MRATHLYSLAEAKTTQVTDGMSEALHPVFDKDGKYLYFTASTDSGASRQPDVFSRTRPVTRSIYLLVLSKDQGSPLAPESDDEKPAADAKDKLPDKVEVKIDLDSIGQRILALPLPPRRYERLQTGKAGVLYAVEVPQPAPGAEPNLTVHRFDLAKRKSDVPLSGARSFQMSFNGEKMLYRQGDRWLIAAPKPMDSAQQAPPEPPALKTENLEVRADPRAEAAE